MKTKRIFAILLAVVCMLTCLPCTAFAAENSSENPVVTSHTITIEIPAGESCESEVMPCIWGQFSPGLVSDYVYNTDEFFINEHNFAYEVVAHIDGGGYVNESFSVQLKMQNATKAALTCWLNGQVYKNDWISINAYGLYYFSINNTTNYDIGVDITYYSWK